MLCNSWKKIALILIQVSMLPALASTNAHQYIRTGKEASPIISSNYSLKTFTGFDSFRGIPDAGWEDNNGVKAGFEGTYFSSDFAIIKHIGIQAGASYGAYNFAGKGHYNKDPKKIESQGFFTFGIYKPCQKNSAWGIGIAYDIMAADNFSVYAQSLWLSQWRLRASSFISNCDEIGANISFCGPQFNKTHNYAACRYKISFSTISQATAFWRHYFQRDVYASIWAGAPLSKRLDQRHSKRAGRFLVGGEISVAFCTNWELACRAQYMHPSNIKRSAASHEYGSNITFAINYNFGENNNAHPFNSNRPYQSLANNSNFLVDAKAQTKLK